MFNLLPFNCFRNTKEDWEKLQKSLSIKNFNKLKFSEIIFSMIVSLGNYIRLRAYFSVTYYYWYVYNAYMYNINNIYKWYIYIYIYNAYM